MARAGALKGHCSPSLFGVNIIYKGISMASTTEVQCEVVNGNEQRPFYKQIIETKSGKISVSSEGNPGLSKYMIHFLLYGGPEENAFVYKGVYELADAGETGAASRQLKSNLLKASRLSWPVQKDELQDRKTAARKSKSHKNSALRLIEDH